MNGPLFWDAFKVGNECTITARGKSTEASTTRSPLWRQTSLEAKPVCGRNKWKGRPSRANSGLEERLWLNACGQICQQVGYFMIIITLIVLFKINKAKQNSNMKSRFWLVHIVCHGSMFNPKQVGWLLTMSFFWSDTFRIWISYLSFSLVSSKLMCLHAFHIIWSKSFWSRILNSYWHNFFHEVFSKG